MMGMNEATATFSALRPRLHGIAYRMLGSVAEAEDVVQDAWLRWHEAARESIGIERTIFINELAAGQTNISVAIHPGDHGIEAAGADAHVGVEK